MYKNSLLCEAIVYTGINSFAFCDALFVPVSGNEILEVPGKFVLKLIHVR